MGIITLLDLHNSSHDTKAEFNNCLLQQYGLTLIIDRALITLGFKILLHMGPLSVQLLHLCLLKLFFLSNSPLRILHILN